MSTYHAIVVSTERGVRVTVAQFLNPFAAQAYRDWIAPQYPDSEWTVEGDAQDSAPPDPWAWVNPRGDRHGTNVLHACRFSPRLGFSQDISDYV